MYTSIQLMVSDEITDITKVNKALKAISKNLVKTYRTIFVHITSDTLKQLNISECYIPYGTADIMYYRASLNNYTQCNYLVVITHNDLEFCSDMLSKFSEENTRIVYV